MRACGVHVGEVNGRDENFFLVRAGLGNDFAGGAGHKTLTPEFQAVAAHAFDDFVADAVHGGDVAAVRDGVTALDGFPRAVLFDAVFFLLARMPADALPDWMRKELGTPD